MNPACSLCRGACCESIVVDNPGGDVGGWLALHGQTISLSQIELPTPCSALNPCGTCSIHAARPQNCRDYPVGGLPCRATVLRRRAADAPAIFAELNKLATAA